MDNMLNCSFFEFILDAAYLSYLDLDLNGGCSMFMLFLKAFENFICNIVFGVDNLIVWRFE